MGDETQPGQGGRAQIDGPVVRPPVTPQVRTENLNALAPRHLAPQWRPGDPVIIIEDMKERLQPGNGKGDAR